MRSIKLGGGFYCRIIGRLAAIHWLNIAMRLKFYIPFFKCKTEHKGLDFCHQLVW